MANHLGMKLGKRPRIHDRRTLLLAHYLVPSPPPEEVCWSQKVPYWGMLANDTLGDCTIAAVGHAVQLWCANTGRSSGDVNDELVKQHYSKWDGWIPADPQTDQGGVELDVLNSWRQEGFGTHKLTAFAAINPLNIDHIKSAIALFGGCYIGVQLPLTAETQDVWHVDPNASPNDAARGSWGGHAVYVVDYDKDTVTCVTWGGLKKMTWGWFIAYCDEAYALLSTDWINDSGVSPASLKVVDLLSDLQEVTN